jgi:chromosome segregation ATPase
MVRTRLKVSDARNEGHPTRKRRASNISSQRTPAPRAKRIRSDSDQLNAESEAALHPNEHEQESENEQDEDGQANKEDRSPSAEPLASSPPIRFHQSTSLTQQVAQTTIHSTPFAPRPTHSGRGRQSMPARLGDLSSEVEVRQFAPLSQALDGRTIRRNRRSHLSEEENTYHDRLHGIQKELKKAKDEIKELEFGREADRHMGTARILDHDKDRLIERLEREKAGVEKDLADHQSLYPQDDGGEVDYDDDMDMNHLDLNIPTEDIAAGISDGEAEVIHVSNSHPPNIPSYEKTRDLYQPLLHAKSVENAKLIAEAQDILIQMRSLEFTTTDGLVPSIVAKVHEAFAGARLKLRQLNLLSVEDSSHMSNEDLLKHMTNCLEGFHQEISSLTHAQTELHNTKTRYREERDTLREQVVKLDDRFNSVDRENDQLRQDKVQLQDQLERSETSIATKADQIEELGEVVKNFRQEVSNLKAEIDRIKEEHEEQMSHMAEELDREHDLREQSEENKDDEISRLKGELELAQEELKNSEAKVKAADENLESLGLALSQIREDAEALEHDCGAERRQREQGQQDYDKLEKDFDELKSQNEKEKNELKMVIANRQKDKEQAEQDVKDHEKKFADLEEAHRTAIEKEVSRRKSTIAAMDQTIDEERKAGEKLGLQADSLKEENEQLQAQLQSANTRNKMVDGQNDTLNVKVAEHEATIQEHATTIQQHEATIHAHDTTIHGLETTIRQHEGTIRDRNATVQAHMTTIQEYTEKIDRITTEKDGDIEDLRDDLCMSQRKLNTAETENSHLHVLLAATMKKMGEHAKQASQDNEELSQMVSQRDITLLDHESEELFNERGEGSKLLNKEIRDEDTPDEEEPHDMEMTGADVEVGLVDTASLQTTTTTYRHSHKLRTKKYRDSGVGMSSSPARQTILEGADD